MNLKIGNSYKIIISINNNVLTYNCNVTSNDEHFISFVDKFGKEYTFNKNLILSIEELNNNGKY